MTVAENVGYALSLKGLASAEVYSRVQSLLARVGLFGFEQRRVTALSGGESQRVAIARALADPQPVLLLDEIQAGLDRQTRTLIRDMIIDLCHNLGATTTFVTHDSEEALSLATQLEGIVAVMDRGRILRIGAPGDLYLDPQSATVARILGDANLISPAAAVAGGVPESLARVLVTRFTSSGPCELLFWRPERTNLRRIRVDDIALTVECERLDFTGSAAAIVGSLGGEPIRIRLPADLQSAFSRGPLTVYIERPDLSGVTA